MKKEVRQAIYDKYIAPTKIERPDYIGVEIEMPVVNLSGEPVDEAVSIKTAESFIRHFGFIVSGRDSNGSITSAKHEKTGDILSFDCKARLHSHRHGRESQCRYQPQSAYPE